jgi:hypothetical protein
MQTDDIRRRAACDRCHTQKTRCPRRPGEDVCDRCVKAQTPCVFSPFRQKKDPEGNPSQGAVLNRQLASRSNGPRQKRKRLISPRPESTSMPRPPTPVLKHLTYIDLNFNSDLMFPSSDHEVTLNDDLGMDWMTNPFALHPEFVPGGAFDDLNLDNQCSFPPGFPPVDFSNLTPESQEDFSSRTNDQVQSRGDINITRPSKYRYTGGRSSNAPDIDGIVNGWASGSTKAQTDSVSDCIRKLSQLSLDLFEHSKTVPPLSIHDPKGPGNLGKVAEKFCSDYCVEETFRLTQNLVEVYPSFLSKVVSPSSSQISTPSFTSRDGDTTSISSNSSVDDHSPIQNSPSKPVTKPALDHASILLILSCHLRLITIYDTLFSHMKICIALKGVASLPQQKALTGAQLRIGAWTPPPSSAVPMQVLLLVQFASQLFNYAADLTAEITSLVSSAVGVVTDDALALSRAAAENVKKRANDM